MRRAPELDAARVLDALHRISLTLGEAAEPEALSALVGREARELLNADEVVLYIWDEEASRLRLAYGEDTGRRLMQTWAAGQGAVGRAFVSGEPVVIADYPNWSDAVPELVEHGVKRVAAVPLKINQRTVGVLAVRFLGARGCQPSQVRALQLLAVPVAAMLDVALARRRAEAGEARLMAIVEHLPCGVAVRDATGTLILLNEDGRTLTGARVHREAVVAEQTPNLTFFDPISGRRLPRNEWPSVRALRGEHVIDQEIRVKLNDHDEPLWMRISAVPLRGADGSIGGSVAIFTDVSRERQLLHDLRLSATENTRLLLELQHAQQRHKELLESMQPAAAERLSGDGLLGRLSARERDVLGRLGRGQTNRQIALEIGLSPGTVKKHVEHILRKLNVADRTHAAVRASELGLAKSPD
jgi:DNA-binding CsgD family transcriptional regulator/PAS domain-containing protein